MFLYCKTPLSTLQLLKLITIIHLIQQYRLLMYVSAPTSVLRVFVLHAKRRVTVHILCELRGYMKFYLHYCVT